jgi:SAM-dependent methyltransferase
VIRGASDSVTGDCKRYPVLADVERCQHKRKLNRVQGVAGCYNRSTEISSSGFLMLKSLVPLRLRRWLNRQRKAFLVYPPVGYVFMGQMRRLQPFNRDFGMSRGTAIDRYYIGAFLENYRADIKGRVLEIGDNTYTRHYGSDVTQSDVLHAVAGNPIATIVGDLASGMGLPDDSFDCIILTQTLQVIYDMPAVAATLHRILKPDGVALITANGIGQISRYDMDRWGEFWRLTTASAERLFSTHFTKENLDIQAYGNVLTASAYLYGLAAEDLSSRELSYHDPDYQMLITIRARK